jgi:hypothetical protein
MKNGSKILSWIFTGIPTPLSSTFNSTQFMSLAFSLPCSLAAARADSRTHESSLSAAFPARSPRAHPAGKSLGPLELYLFGIPLHSYWLEDERVDDEIEFEVEAALAWPIPLLC